MIIEREDVLLFHLGDDLFGKDLRIRVFLQLKEHVNQYQVEKLDLIFTQLRFIIHLYYVNINILPACSE